MESVRGAVSLTARTDLQTESWRLLREEWAADAEAQAECDEWERRRTRVRPQMVALLRRFLSGAIGLEQFRATFDRRTRTDWDAFGLRGSSGAMYLNALAKHAEHPIVLARQLRAALDAPANVDDASRRLDDLLTAVAPPALPLDAPDLGGAHEHARPGSPTHDASRPESPAAQPSRAVFLTTMWWHLQAPDRWPSFQPSAREVLREEEDLFAPTGEPVSDYLRFREAFLSLAAELSLSVWRLEHLCWWHAQRPAFTDPTWSYDEPLERRAVRHSRARLRHHLGAAPVGEAQRTHTPGRAAVRESPPPYVPFTEPPPLDHTHVQWLLAKVGHQLGCRVWIAANDHRRAWGGETLGSLSVPRLPPLGLDPDSQRVVACIDVVWLTGSNQVTAAFEVEHTTSVYSGLLRMADLAALSPNLAFPLYVVAPASRRPKVRRELSRPAFRALGVDRRCGFFSSEALLRALPGIARWATGPEAIEKLVERLGTRD